MSENITVEIVAIVISIFALLGTAYQAYLTRQAIRVSELTALKNRVDELNRFLVANHELSGELAKEYDINQEETAVSSLQHLRLSILHQAHTLIKAGIIKKHEISTWKWFGNWVLRPRFADNHWEANKKYYDDDHNSFDAFISECKAVKELTNINHGREQLNTASEEKGKNER